MIESENSDMKREKIEKTFKHSPRIEDRIFDLINVDDSGNCNINLENERIERVLRKHAIGHIEYEAGEQIREDPLHFSFSFANQLKREQISAYNQTIQSDIYPEYGCRLFQRVVEDGKNDWVVVQSGNYRYYIEVGSSILIRIVIREYLYFEAIY